MSDEERNIRDTEAFKAQISDNFKKSIDKTESGLRKLLSEIYTPREIKEMFDDVHEFYNWCQLKDVVKPSMAIEYKNAKKKEPTTVNSLCNLATQIWIQDQFRPDESSNSTELKCQAKLEAYLRNCRAIRANSPTYLPNIVDWRRLDATIEWWEYDSDEETENSLDLHAEYKEQIDTLKEKESELQQQIERLKTSSAKPTSSSSEVVLRVDNTSKIRFCGNDMDNFLIQTERNSNQSSKSLENNLISFLSNTKTDGGVSFLLYKRHH